MNGGRDPKAEEKPTPPRQRPGVPGTGKDPRPGGGGAPCNRKCSREATGAGGEKPAGGGGGERGPEDTEGGHPLEGLGLYPKGSERTIRGLEREARILLAF